MTKGGQSTVKLPPWRERPYEDTESLAWCRCTYPVPLRKYARHWLCALCSKWIPEQAA